MLKSFSLQLKFMFENFYYQFNIHLKTSSQKKISPSRVKKEGDVERTCAGKIFSFISNFQ